MVVVLVVEADRLVNETFCELLSALGYETRSAVNVDEAMLEVRTAAQLDAMLAHRALFRERERALSEVSLLRPDMGIVLTTSGGISASDGAEDPIRLLQKPVKTDELVAALEAVLPQR